MAVRKYKFPDGIERTVQEEHDLNQLFAKVFAGDRGARILEYLRKITWQTVTPQGTESAVLHDQEGMRRLMYIIQTRVDHGRAGSPKPGSESDGKQRA